MRMVSLNDAASSSELVARTLSGIVTSGRYSGLVRVAAMVSATLGSCAHRTISLSQRAATVAMAVPNAPAPITAIFTCAVPSFARFPRKPRDVGVVLHDDGDG